jgi:hypothetical protein
MIVPAVDQRRKRRRKRVRTISLIHFSLLNSALGHAIYHADQAIIDETCPRQSDYLVPQN